MVKQNLPHFQPGEAPPGINLIAKAWNLMDGIDWVALPIVMDMLGIEDSELFIHQLCAIRSYHNRKMDS